MKDYIQFINHASVVISNGNKSILTIRGIQEDF